MTLIPEQMQYFSESPLLSIICLVGYLLYILAVSAFQISHWGLWYIWHWFFEQVNRHWYNFIFEHPVPSTILLKMLAFLQCPFLAFCQISDGCSYVCSFLGLLFWSTDWLACLCNITMLDFFVIITITLYYI